MMSDPAWEFDEVWTATICEVPASARSVSCEDGLVLYGTVYVAPPSKRAITAPPPLLAATPPATINALLLGLSISVAVPIGASLGDLVNEAPPSVERYRCQPFLGPLQSPSSHKAEISEGDEAAKSAGPPTFTQGGRHCCQSPPTS
jgi:hypothetical protein